VHPSYSECKANGFPATVDVAAGCNFILSTTTDKYFNTEGKEEGKDATVSLECTEPTKNDISITIPEINCTLTLSAEHKGIKVNQTLLGVTYQNTGLGAARDIDVKVTVDKIHYTAVGFGCPLVGYKETNTDAFLTQTVTVKGFSDSAHTKQVGVFTS
jgi:hypothetical protein